jgi:hypothetical protein
MVGYCLEYLTYDYEEQIRGLVSFSLETLLLCMEIIPSVVDFQGESQMRAYRRRMNE